VVGGKGYAHPSGRESKRERRQFPEKMRKVLTSQDWLSTIRGKKKATGSYWRRLPGGKWKRETTPKKERQRT